MHKRSREPRFYCVGRDPMVGNLQVIQGDDTAKNDGERENTTFPAWKEGRGRERECLVNEQKQWERGFGI